MRLQLIVLIAVVATMWQSVQLKAQVDADAATRDAMILFSYWPKQGQEKAFHDGYKQHLEWHEKNEDSIMWYAWDVVVGRRAGLFIDGAFDIAFEALDNRVKPREDAADFLATAAAFAEVNDRVLYRLRTDLSRATPLEDREPGRMVVATSYRVRPGQVETFESMLKSDRLQADRLMAVYEVVVGSETPQYLLLEQRASWADVGGAETHPLAMGNGEDGAGDLRASVEAVESEIWRYRRDLTYFP